MICGKDLLDPPSGIIVFAKRHVRGSGGTFEFDGVWWVCKGMCDRVGQQRLARGLGTAWEDIPDVMTPTIYVKWVVTLLNNWREGVVYSDEALLNLRTFMLTIFPHVARHLTGEEKKRITDLQDMPSALGGLG
jgi:hypothetical protein